MIVSYLGSSGSCASAELRNVPRPRKAAARGRNDPYDFLKSLRKEPLVPPRSARARQVGAARKIMNESTIRKSAVASTTNDPEIRIPRGVRCVVWCAVLMFANLAVACALFESPVGFPTEFLHSATNVMVIKIRKMQARCDFEDIPPGTYAMAVIHDENMNGKLDTNWLGIPTEGYGFSNDAKALLGAPSFSAASFQYDGRNLDLTMSLHY